jgi:3-keto-5-aminohexanoate cleavage enzyme
VIHLLPFGSYCGVAAFGGFQLKANTAAILIGGMTHVRTGLEDNIYYDRARKHLATNRQLVKRIIALTEFFERPIATPAQMRRMIGLKPVTSFGRKENNTSLSVQFAKSRKIVAI